MSEKKLPYFKAAELKNYYICFHWILGVHFSDEKFMTFDRRDNLIRAAMISAREFLCRNPCWFFWRRITYLIIFRIFLNNWLDFDDVRLLSYRTLLQYVDNNDFNIIESDARTWTNIELSYVCWQQEHFPIEKVLKQVSEIKTRRICKLYFGNMVDVSELQKFISPQILRVNNEGLSR